jgi:hypothetical protein
VLADGATMGRNAVGDGGDVCCAGSASSEKTTELAGTSASTEPVTAPAGLGCC